MLLPLMDKYGPTINWNLTGALPRGTTFTRTQASPQTTTAIGLDGSLKYFNANEPRFEYDPVTGRPLGLLYEPQRTNSYAYSNSFNSWNYSYVLKTWGATTSPDGTSNGWSIVPSTNLETHGVYASLAAGTWGLSIYAKANGCSYLYLQTEGTDEGSAYFNLATGVVESVTKATAAIKDVGNGWYRCSVVSTMTSAGYSRICVSDTGSRTYYAGNGTSGLYLFGAQIESGSSVTSYIPTSGAAATRADDALSFVVPNGVTKLRYTFDDNSTQDVVVSPGAYTVPTNLNRPHIKRIVSV